MKNRRNVIIAFLLCVSLIVGVGYAALTDTLTVDGKARISAGTAAEEFNEDIKFERVVSQDNCVATISATDNDWVDVTITEGVGVLGDTAVVELEVSNAGNSTAMLTVNAMTGDSANFKVAADNTTYEIPANGSVVVKLTVTLLQTIVSDLDTTFQITFTATSAG